MAINLFHGGRGLSEKLWHHSRNFETSGLIMPLCLSFTVQNTSKGVYFFFGGGLISNRNCSLVMHDILLDTGIPPKCIQR